jgi:glycosyltransferase involved in cell wall biosynthesis
MKPGPPSRLAYLVSHPIQYQAPLLRRIASDPEIDLTVFFGSDLSSRGYRDEGFGVDVTWDIPLLDGYRYEFLPKRRDNGTISFSSPISSGIYQRLKAGRFDALWVHGYASINSLQAIVAAKWLGLPVMIRAESWLADRNRSRVKLAVKRAFFQILRRGIVAVLPIGTRNAEYWSHYVKDVPQFLVPYAVDNAWFAVKTANADTSKLRKQLGLDEGRPVVLFASKLQSRKNAADLIAAYRSLSLSTAAPYLVIVGDGEERVRLEALAAGLEGIRFVGFRNQTELPAFFALADIFVLPSRHEPWGLIVNEAMAAGCAVIVSDDCGCAADLITESTGEIFPVGDITALSSALKHMLADPDATAARGRAAQQRMETWSFGQDIQGLKAALAYIRGLRS